MTAWTTSHGDMVRIKICGVRTQADIDAAIDAGAHAVGLVLVPSSPRAIDVATARTLIDWCSDAITPICLHVDPTIEQLQQPPCRWVQLHGDEPDDVIHAAAASASVVKAVPAEHTDRLLALDADDTVSRLLVDAPSGGSGEAFDHEAFAATRATLRTPLVLAGGLDADTVALVIDTIKPWGVDVSSGVESTRGTKDHGKIRAFCDAINQR
ncbi:MAG: phosphoribosylanthranilate isomerase [Phycisphaerales bacterium]|nr:phosphoribosylanthranilate isomerase [Phycisphaerales bacterium]